LDEVLRKMVYASIFMFDFAGYHIMELCMILLQILILF